jgi:hypothetical protein
MNAAKKPKKKHKKVNLKTIGEHFNMHENRVSLALRGDDSIDQDLAEKVQAYAKEIGYSKTEHPDQHHNCALTQDKADTIVEGIFQNQSLEKIASASGLSETTAFKLVRGVKVPHDYPTNPDEWRDSLLQYMEIALWKGIRRLADGAMDQIAPGTVPIASGILLDKYNLMKGQPQSIHASLSLTMSHKELISELRPKREVTINDEQIPEA